MKARITHHGRQYEVDYGSPVDLSISLKGDGGVQAWGVGPARIEPYRLGEQEFRVSAGSPVNFYELQFSPHAHVTHTESLGHIHQKWQSVNRIQPGYRGLAWLHTVAPVPMDEDRVIPEGTLPGEVRDGQVGALVLRTLPNSTEKAGMNYSGCNPPYFMPLAMQEIVEAGIEHLLVDLPSVDRESDGGRVEAHHIFWGLKDEQEDRPKATITELIFVPGTLADGLYWLELHTAPIECDATPSRPLLYPVKPIEG